MQLAQSPFTMAITAYALALLDPNQSAAREAFSALKREAFVTGTARFSVLLNSPVPPL